MVWTLCVTARGTECPYNLESIVAMIGHNELHDVTQAMNRGLAIPHLVCVFDPTDPVLECESP